MAITSCESTPSIEGLPGASPSKLRNPKRSHVIKAFLQSHTHPDLAALYTPEHEVQVNVAKDGGEPLKDAFYKGRKLQGWTDGKSTWKPFRIPLNAYSEPEGNDYPISFDLDAHADAIGMTGWNWAKRQSEWVGFDFDALVGHSQQHGRKLSDSELVAVRDLAASIPWVTVRKSTSGRGLHLYVHLATPIPTATHTEHQALARSILGSMSAAAGFDFFAKADVAGGNMWIWARRMEGTDGLSLIRLGTPFDRVPADWRDHLPVVMGTKPRAVLSQLASGPSTELDEWLSNQAHVQLDDEHKRLLAWLDEKRAALTWDADRHMLRTHTCWLAKAHAALGLKGLFQTISPGTDLDTPNCFAYPAPRGAWAVRRYSQGVAEAPTWVQDGGWTRCTLNEPGEGEPERGGEGPCEFSMPPAQVFANSARDKAALRMGQLAERLDAITPGWPKRLDERLFVAGADDNPVYLDSAARLFAFIDARAQVAWTKGARFITQERFYEHLRMNAARYDSIETLPHWPPMPGTYYMHRPLPEPSGKLATLLDFFCPATPIDRALIQALILSPFWGGQPGNRPAFLITGGEQDQGQGRGVGKSTLVDIISQELAGGSIDVAPTDEIAKVKTRLLSGNRCRVRFARLDNVKTLKFSWADLEGLITASEISGHALFLGEGRRPNVLTWAITLNGASLSKDLAQRVIPVRLGRPQYDATWEGRVREFIQTYRWELIAEIGRTLEADAPPLTPRSRWAAWEQGVLSRVEDPAACQAEILARQGAIDDDGEERDQVAEYFAAQLRDLGHDPETGVVLIPAPVAAEWLSQVARKPYATNAASAHINSLCLPRLTRSRTKQARGFIWRGAAASPTSEHVPLEPDRKAAPTPSGLRLKA